MANILEFLKGFWKPILIILLPIIASPLALAEDKSTKCIFVVVVMGIYWMAEVMPLAATALLPVFLLPMLGLVKSKVIATTYLPDISFLFIGGLIVAVAVEKCNLHQRIALRVLTLVGSAPRRIMLGFMAVTAFLSMWISNTATTAMMVPIAQSVVMELVKNRKTSLTTAPRNGDKGREAGEDDVEMTLVSDAADNDNAKEKVHAEKKEDVLDMDSLSPGDLGMAKGLLISICFAANIGGTGTVTGTPPNLVVFEMLNKLFDGRDTGVTFLTWMVFAIPLMLVSLVLCWLILVLVFMRKIPPADPAVNRMLQERFAALPRVSFAEKSVLVCFAALLTMWVMRKPGPKGGIGFGKYFEPGCYSDATSAIIIAVLLFLLPDQWPDFRNPSQSVGRLMDWDSMQKRFPWSVVLLLGGGFALAEGVKRSGLSATVGTILGELEGMDMWLIQVLCVGITMFITNICSNTVTANIFVPIVAALAVKLEENPLSLMLPVTLACSYAFTLPVATPPNAIVFASGLIKVTDLLFAGTLVTIVSLVAIVAYMQTYAVLVFGLNEFPAWALGSNTTAPATF